jgi:hypothetical protein
MQSLATDDRNAAGPAIIAADPGGRARIFSDQRYER